MSHYACAMCSKHYSACTCVILETPFERMEKNKASREAIKMQIDQMKRRIKELEMNLKYLEGHPNEY